MLVVIQAFSKAHLGNEFNISFETEEKNVDYITAVAKDILWDHFKPLLIMPLESGVERI